MTTVGAAASETPDGSGLVLPPTPAAAAHIFGPRVELAERYVALLADTGITHGLIGPREAPRLWDRHVLNCAVVAPHFAADSTVIDIGSGAGLPGLVFAIARPDLSLLLIEPLARRCRWLETTVRTLGLTNVAIHNLRAEAAIGVCRAPYVTARAVARIDVLARWSFPLLEASGSLVALKGQSAQRELDEEQATLKTLGAVSCTVTTFGAEVLDPPTQVMILGVGSPQASGTAHGSSRGTAGPRAGRRRTAPTRQAPDQS